VLALENSPNILFIFANFITVIQPKFFRETTAFADSAVFIIRTRPSRFGVEDKKAK
jgi:hypothetical protein